MEATVRRIEPQTSLDAKLDIPLVIDLDRTLILADSLQEAFAKLLFSKPIRALASLGALLQGRAAFKAAIAGHDIPDVTCMPYRTPLVDLLRQEKARGRPIHLVTAADQKIADAVAGHLGLFDSATGSDGQRNLKGPHKLSYLRGRFADGFIYAGDHAADLPLFKAARGAILCDVTPRIAASARADATVLAEMRRPPRKMNVWPRVLRVHQWSKNALIFVPLFVGHAYGNLTNVLATAAGFILVCLLTSATYMVNDIADLDADRLHHS